MFIYSRSFYSFIYFVHLLSSKRVHKTVNLSQIMKLGPTETWDYTSELGAEFIFRIELYNLNITNNNTLYIVILFEEYFNQFNEDYYLSKLTT